MGLILSASNWFRPILPRYGMHARKYHHHYNDVVRSAIDSSITGVSVVCLIVCAGVDQTKHQSSASVDSPVTDEFPAQRKSNAENVSIWCRHHEKCYFAGVITCLCFTCYIVRNTYFMIQIDRHTVLECVDFPLSSHSKYLTSKQSIITCGQDKFGIDRPLQYSIMEELFIQYPSLWYDHGHWPYFLAYEMFVYDLFHIIIIISDLDIIGAVIVVVILSLILPLMLYWSHRFVDNIYRQHHHHHFHHCYLHCCMFVSVTWYSNLTKTCLKMSHWTTPNDIVKPQHGWSRTWLL